MTKKTAATDSAAKSASVAKSFKQRLAQFGRWLGKTFAKLLLGLVLGMVIYLIYLDARVTRKFEGKKWQIPAQVFAKPLSLRQGVPLSKAQLIIELEALNYRQTKQLTGPGEYTVSPKHVSVVRRAFDFPVQARPERWLTIEIVGDKIGRIVDRNTHESVREVILEPQLIERLLSAQHEDREFLPLNAFPEQFKDTLLLLEDRDFYHHSGVSIGATLRALWQNVKAGRTVQGGSTLTQQLAKNVFLNPDRTLIRKVNEAFIALLLDYRYSKDQILEAYVNEVFLGQFHNRSIHGFGLSSHYYFAKPLNELLPHEFAVLIAIIKGPTYYNPHRYPKRALARRDLVLRLMFEQHLLDKSGYEQAISQGLGISDKRAFKPSRYPAYISQVKRELKRTLRDSDILTDGIKVYTNLDPRLQRATEQVIAEQLPKIESERQLSDIQAASVSVDFHEAAIVAMVGGRDTKFSGLNRALDMRRNIGSLIKPAVYLSALEQPKKYTLATLLEDKPIIMVNQEGKNWSPENFDKNTEGQVSLLYGLSHSKNIPTVNLGMALGTDTVSNSLQKLGVSVAIPQYPSLFLGALELSLLDVSQMYATIAANGVYKRLSTLRTITAVDGSIIWQRSVTARANFTTQASYLTQVALKEAASSGTAKRLKQTFPHIQFAGKTGTTDQLRDSWFSGFDQQTLSTFWLGKDDYSPVELTGSNGALRLFTELYKIVPAQTLVDIVPSGIISGYFAHDTGKMYDVACKNALRLPAITVVDRQTVICSDPE